jgi:hypothetical protein
VSFGIFVQGFANGSFRETNARHLAERLAPYLVRDAERSKLQVRAASAEIYGTEHLATGFMVTHIDGDAIYDAIVDVAAACDLVIAPVGCAAAITRQDQREHLPEGLRADAVLVTSGAELRALIASS